MTIRPQGISWLKNNFPENSDGEIRVSKYHPQDLWFFTLPSRFLEDKSGWVTLLLQKRGRKDDFHCLVVPMRFFSDNKHRLDLRGSGKEFDLHISAKRHIWLSCERSKNLSFREFEQDVAL